MDIKFVKPERIWLKEHPVLDETWVQRQIAEDPSILGLGELLLKDKERNQPHAGRLDILLQDPDTDRRYEVEVQLGRTDESHLIRTIEYWDIERKRYPQYDHCAVIVAEEVTSRFLNVISLFNSTIPLIAIQMSALGIGDQVTLVFTTVLNELSRGLDEDDEDEDQEPADRNYWEGRAGRETLELTDRILAFLRQWDPKVDLRYKRGLIGLVRNGASESWVRFRPKRQFLRLEMRVPQTKETDEALEEAGLDTMLYRSGRYRVRLTKADLAKHESVIVGLLKQAYDNRDS